MEQKKQEFDRGKGRQRPKKYHALSERIRHLRQKEYALKRDTSPELRELTAIQKRLPASDPLDPHYRRLHYVRYADDFLIGIIGSKREAEQVYQEVKDFLNTTLKLDISEEKSGIHHAKDGSSFLGYVVQSRTTDKLIKAHRPAFTKVVATRRAVRDRIQLRIPPKKMSEFCQRKGYGNYETLQPSQKPHWLQMDDEEILLAYNAEMRGIANYYALANHAKRGLHKLMFLAQSSFLATLAGKYGSSINKEAARLRQGRDLCVTTYTKEGKPKRYILFKLRNWIPPQPKVEIDKVPQTMGYCWRTSPLVFNGLSRGSVEERRGRVPETERWKGRALVCV